MHASYYKRPLLWGLICYIVCLLFFYTPGPGPQDIYHHISKKEVTLTAHAVGFSVTKKNNQNTILRVQSVDGQPVKGLVYARFEKGKAPLWKEKVQVSGKLKKPYSQDIMGNFDWGAYLASKNVFTEIKVNDIHILKQAPLFFRWIAQIRQDILQTFDAHFSGDLSGIARGILLGERGEISAALYRDFQDSGAIHLLVASGGNVAFVTLIVFALGTLFGFSRRKTAWVALILAGIYTLIAGADAPLTRAYFMAVCAVLGFVFHRNSGVFQGIVLSCWAILLITPSAVFETGFQMSFLATFAIVICLNNYQFPYHCPKGVRFFAQIFMVTLSTQLVLLPVFTNIFYKVSFVGLLSNMVLVPFASVLMMVCALFYLFSCIGLAFLLKPVIEFLLFLFALSVKFFAAFPLAAVSVAAWKTSKIICYYAILFLVFHLPLKPFVRKLYKPLLGGVLLLWVFSYFFLSASEVYMLNDWNKNSLLLKTSCGQHVLIGAEIDGEKLAKAVLSVGEKELDFLLLFNTQKGQTQNIEILKEKIKINKIIFPFQDIWPGEEIKNDCLHIQAQWGLMQDKNAQWWRRLGYSGKDDALSYEINGKDFSFISSGNGRFILHGGKTTNNLLNASRRVVL